MTNTWMESLPSKKRKCITDINVIKESLVIHGNVFVTGNLCILEGLNVVINGSVKVTGVLIIHSNTVVKVHGNIGCSLQMHGSTLYVLGYARINRVVTIKANSHLSISKGLAGYRILLVKIGAKSSLKAKSIRLYGVSNRLSRIFIDNNCDLDIKGDVYLSDLPLELGPSSQMILDGDLETNQGIDIKEKCVVVVKQNLISQMYVLMKSRVSMYVSGTLSCKGLLSLTDTSRLDVLEDTHLGSLGILGNSRANIMGDLLVYLEIRIMNSTMSVSGDINALKCEPNDTHLCIHDSNVSIDGNTRVLSIVMTRSKFMANNVLARCLKITDTKIKLMSCIQGEIKIQNDSLDY